VNMMTIEISCIEVWREISKYVDGEVDGELRERMQAHFKVCKHCSAILDGTRNVVQLVTDGKTFELPANFSKRLYSKLESKLRNS
jgi:hypothetical protein